MRVLILGGTGFIGRALTAKLLARGHEVIVSSRLARPASEKFHTARMAALGPADDDASDSCLAGEDKGFPLSAFRGVSDGSSLSSEPQEGAALPHLQLLYVREQEKGVAAESSSLQGTEEVWKKKGGQNSPERSSSRALSSEARSVQGGAAQGSSSVKRHSSMVKGLVEAAAIGEKLPLSFWKTAEELGSLSGEAQEDFFFSHPEDISRGGIRGEGWARKSPEPFYAVWDGVSVSALRSLLDGVDGVVNLTGEYLGGRWTEEKKSALRESRVRAGKALAQAVAQRASASESFPAVVVQASSLSYYGFWGDFPTAPLCREDRMSGGGFLASLVSDWEDAVSSLDEVGQGQTGGQSAVRRCVVRLAPVVGRGGFLKHILPLFRAGFGGIPGDGDQPFAWVHLEDVVDGMTFLLEHRAAEGVYNLCAPESGTMKEFCETLGWVLHRPVWLPMPEFYLRLTMGEVADELLLAGQRADSRRLLEAGFTFRYTDLEQALKEVAG